MSEYIISAKDVTFKYRNDDVIPEKIPAAVDGVTLDVKRGSFTALIGHNGSGKSTLAKLLSGVLVPLTGEVKIYPKGTHDALDCSNEQQNFDIRKTVGMVFQNPDNQLVATLVEDDVAFAPENLGLESAKIRKRVDEALETVGLTGYAQHDTHKLSGGQKQRVAIAGVLAMKPECIIFDESTAMLDPKGREDIMETILKLKEFGITVVLITHYMEEAAKADEIFVINEGKLLMKGTPREVFSKVDALAVSGLEPPQASSLVRALKDMGAEVETEGVIGVDSAVEAIKKYLDKKQARKEKGNA